MLDLLTSRNCVKHCTRLECTGTFLILLFFWLASCCHTTANGDCHDEDIFEYGPCTETAKPGGKCGNGTCCSNGECCSPHGYCGTKDEHCGKGCQKKFSARDSLCEGNVIERPPCHCENGRSLEGGPCGAASGKCCASGGRVGFTEKLKALLKREREAMPNYA